MFSVRLAQFFSKIILLKHLADFLDCEQFFFLPNALFEILVSEFSV